MADSHRRATRQLGKAVNDLVTACREGEVAAARSAMELIARWLSKVRPGDPMLTGAIDPLQDTALGSLAANPLAMQVWRAVMVAAFPDSTARAVNLVKEYDVTGDLTYLTRAIDAFRGAVRAAPDRALYLSNLGTALNVLYERTADTAVLREAIELHRQARMSISDLEDRPRRLLSFAVALYFWSNRFGDLAALEEAISSLRDAVRELPDGHPDRPVYLSNLGLVLGSRFYAPGGTSDHLADAIAVLQSAVDLLSDDSPHRAKVLDGLAALLRIRHGITKLTARTKHARNWAIKRAIEEKGGEVPAHLASLTPNPPVDLTDADQAMRLARAALAALPRDHPDRTVCLTSLGLALGERFDRSAKETDQAEAIAALAEAAGDPHARPSLRAFAGVRGAWLAADAGDWPAAATGYRTAVDMLPLLAPHELGRDDQEYQLRDFSGLAGNAAAAVLRAGGDALDAFTVLDRGRGVLLAQAMDLDLHDGPTVSTSLAPDGPVVAVNLSAHGCHALIMTTDDVLAVPLPDINAQKVTHRSRAFQISLEIVSSHEGAGFVAEDRWAATRTLDQTLAWLWDSIAEPVLAALGHSTPPVPGVELPRLWWMPTGMLSFLPLHAAGHHTAFDGRSVLDHVVSSYTPTLRVLTHARTRSVSNDGPASPLVVAMSKTEGLADLPAARQEVDLIRSRFPRSRVLADQEARRADVLSSLPASDWVHFACHADSDVDEPSASRLLLTDGPLTVLEIGRLRTPRAYLAYLSACATGRGGTDLADEAIHISSAFQLAGYPHVIATLWPITDYTAGAFAHGIYATFAADSDTIPARAVHAATRRLRDSHNGTNPVAWAAHVHAGP